MRTSRVLKIVVVAAAFSLVSACTGGDGGSAPDEPAQATTQGSTTLKSLDLDWPDSFDPGTPPEAPEGFSEAMVTDMAGALRDWARATSVDSDVWHADRPVEAVSAALPDAAAKALEQQVKDAVSPRLAVANVFADDVEVVGKPQVTTSWKVSTADSADGKPFMLLELQTRTAYEVRTGTDGPTSVIGVLRVHGLSAFKDTTDDYGVSSGWQEFGAGDCALALDDDLYPDGDAAETAKDLKVFVRVGDGDRLLMPSLGADEQVDADYLKRCRAGQT